MANIQKAMDYNGLIPGHMQDYETMMQQFMGYTQGQGTYKPNSLQATSSTYKPNSLQATSSTFKPNVLNQTKPDYMAKFVEALGFGMGVAYGSGMQHSATCRNCGYSSTAQGKGTIDDILSKGKMYWKADNYNDKKSGAKSDGYSQSESKYGNAYKA